MAKADDTRAVDSTREGRSPPQLFPYQTRAVEHHCAVLRKFGASIDASDTGVGKTWISAGIARVMCARAFVIAPKSALLDWYEVCELMNVDAIIVNYEAIKAGKYFASRKDFLDNARIDCPFVKLVPETPGKSPYEWNLPPDTLIIVDEAHKGKNMLSANSALIMSLRGARVPIMLLSATIADRPTDLHVVTYLLGLTQQGKHAYAAWNRRFPTLTHIHNEIFPAHGYRISIKDIALTTNTIRTEIVEDYVDAPARDTPTHHLVRRIRARQDVEMSKVPYICKEARAEFKSGKNVVIFFNFKDSMSAARAALEPIPIYIINGDQDARARYHARTCFNTSHSICILQIGAGGTCLSLQDKTGEWPRVSFISPPQSSIELTQALGRIYRVGAASDVVQRIIYLGGDAIEMDIEKRTRELLGEKTDTLNTLLTGGLRPDM